MSPHGINSLVGDLVEMAKATERLPQLEQELDAVRRQEQVLLGKLDLMSADLEQSRNYAASLEQKVRSLEVERDDASFRVMEAEDLNHSILTLARTASVDLAMMIQKLDPPKPEPVKEPEPQEHTASGWNPDIEPLPEAVHSLEDTTLDWKQDQAETSVLPQGQSESSPTAGSVSGHSPVDQPVVASDQLTTEPTKGPYSGKRYRDVAGYVNLHDWIDGGGTEEDYYSNLNPSF